MNNIEKLERELLKSKRKLKEIEDYNLKVILEHELFVLDAESLMRKLIVCVERKGNGQNFN